ncbi:uncharacterized protein si:dkeyp-75h12.7 isoform X2 [Silurus meridionalis]|nr:uncharacterized protein si:dkeyp-75h12.7 isoform X2 [Silurus meridionalis]XP_046707083.1 uncharacterized protein si:dkeyp-75h12.7 isoform X2 [Silurus meridionalis]
MWAVPVIVLVISLVLNVGPSFSSCTTRVRVQDLGCHMHWSCSDINTTTTTFTVQTKIQGAEWQNVSHCFQISSYSCDVSQVFKSFELFNFVMLGLNQGHGNMNWTSTELCDPVKDPNASFSPPSLSLYLNEQQLWVEVIFPCAPNVVCQDEDYEEEEGDEKDTPTCCTITDILPQNTTVTLYNKHNMNENQTHTMMVEGSPWKLPFLGLSPGQEYCAVAHYASSPLSDPQCIHVPLLENPNLLVLALCGVFIALLLLIGLVLRRWWSWCASTDLKLPQSLMSVQSLDQEGSIVDEPRQPAIEEEESIAYLSIISLNNTLETSFLRTSSVPQSVYPHLQSLEARYYTTTILQNRIYNENVDTDYLFRGLETDGVSDPAPSVYYQWPRWSSLPALKTGMVCLLGNVLSSEDSVIPLSSVRVAGVHLAKTESDHSFTVFPSLYCDRD